MMLKKNNSIAFFRIICIYLIAAYHFNNPYPYIEELGMKPGWDTPVEFFFIVSGFLLYETYINGKCYSAVKYIKGRYRKIYPGYIMAFILVFIAKAFSEREKRSVTMLFISAIPEIFGLQSLKLNRGWTDINPTLWFISVIFVDGFIMFALLKLFKKRYLTLFSPFLMGLTYSMLYFRFGYLDVVVDTDGFINYALLRGLSDMSLGAYSNLLYKRMNDSVNRSAYRKISFFAMCMIWVAMLFKGKGIIDFILLFALVFAVPGCFLETENPFLTSKPVMYLSELTLYIYLIHELFRSYIIPGIFGMGKPLGTKIMLLILYLALITAGGVFLRRATKLRAG